MILHPGDIAVDYVAKKSPVVLVAAGVRLVVRYDSPNPTNPKNLSIVEAQGLHDAGLGILVVFESKNVDPLQGATLGAQHGALHESHLNGIYHYPADTVSIVAVDFDTTLPQIEMILDYLRAFNAATSRPLWVYGEADLIDTAVLRGVVVGGWQTVAWSHHRVSSHAFCLQHATPVHPAVAAIGAIDDNTVLQEFKAWSTTVDPPIPQPVPTPSEDIVNYYVVTGANARFIGDPTKVRWTGPGDDKIAAAIATQLAAGNLVQVNLTGGPGAFAATFLDGTLPTGDTLHTWTGDEFANTVEIQAGHGDTTDQVARDAAAHANAGVDNIDKRLQTASEALA